MLFEGNEMRVKSKPSTAHCNEAIYTSYLLSDPRYTSCTRLAEVMHTLSHDSVNRFLERERFEPKDLFDEEAARIELAGGVLSVDDSVLDKPYMNPKHVGLIGYYWSGKHKRVVKGLHLITLFYTDSHGVSVPVNYRIYDKTEGKTKNDYFLDMLDEVLAWGLKPSWVTGNSWYASIGNMKAIRKLKLKFMFGVEHNRTISIARGQYIQIQKLEDWQDDEQTVYLKGYGMVKVFRQVYKNAYRYYIMSVPELEQLPDIKQADFERVHAAHWSIERYHRALKQVCHVEHFQVRGANSIKNPIFCAIRGFVQLEFMRLDKLIAHWYEVQRDLFLSSIRNFIQGKANYQAAVNA